MQLGEGKTYTLTLTSPISSAAHAVEGASPTQAVVSAARAWPVVGPRTLQAHGLALRLVVRPDLCAAALEDLNVPEGIFTILTQGSLTNTLKHSHVLAKRKGTFGDITETSRAT